MAPEVVVRFAAEQMDVGPGECCRPNQNRIRCGCPGCRRRADRTAAHPKEEAGRALAPAELGESAGASRTTTAQHVAVRRSSGQRTSVTRCSLSAPQLELYTCTCTLLMPPPQSTQWPLPYT